MKELLTHQIFGISVQLIFYDILITISVLSILLVLAKSRLKEFLDDAIAKRIVWLCGLTIVYEFKFQICMQISHFQFFHNYGFTLISITQLLHNLTLIAGITDAICWTITTKRSRWRPKATKISSYILWAILVLSSIATVCYIQFVLEEKYLIFIPKDAALLLSIPLSLIFFCSVIFSRTIRSTYTNGNNETVVNIYSRMIAVSFVTNSIYLILIVTRCDLTTVRLLHALNGCFFAIIAYRLDDVKPLKITSVNLNMEEV